MARSPLSVHVVRPGKYYEHHVTITIHFTQSALVPTSKAELKLKTYLAFLAFATNRR